MKWLCDNYRAFSGSFPNLITVSEREEEREAGKRRRVEVGKETAEVRNRGERCRVSRGG